MHIQNEEFVLACLEANKAWAEGEGVFIHKFQNGDGINENDFDLFLKRWQVMRNTVKTKREVLRGFINDTLFNGPACVENAAKHARDNGYSTKLGKEKTISLPTSLISKVAFYKNPNDITPVDKHSLKGIRNCMPKGNDLPKTTHEYSKYLGNPPQN